MQNAPWLLDEEILAHFPIRKIHADDHHGFSSENEGALSVDVFEYPEALVIRAPMAGVHQGDLDLSIHNDMLTIRGKRVAQTEETTSSEEIITLHQECHWGSFSRSIILPFPVRADEADATLTDGILTIRIPKATKHGKIHITKK